MSQGRFIYNSINIDFEKNWSNFQVDKKSIQSVSKSVSGITKTLQFYNQDIISLQRTLLTSSEIEQLEDWWEYIRDGSSFELYRDKDMLLYIPFEGKSSNTSDGNSATFARTGIANVLDPDTGLITQIAASTDRFPDGNFGRGLLIEKAVTNLLDNTEDFTHADWTATDLTATANQVISPDGTANADKLAATNDEGNIYQDTATAINNTTGTFSIYLKCMQDTVSGEIELQDDTGTFLNGETFIATTEWQRIEVTYTDSSANANNWRAYIEINNNGDEVYVWGAQLEIGTQYSTTYIEDAGARNAESIYYDVSNLLPYNITSWSIGFWFKSSYNYNNHIQGNARFFTITRSGVSDTHSGLYITSAGNIEVDIYDESDTVAANISYSGGGYIAQDTWCYIVITCDATISNGVKMYLNGTLVGTSSSNSFSVTQGGRLYIGCDISAGDEADGIFDDFIMEKRVLSASEITSRYNSNKAIGMRKNYWSAVKLAESNFNPIQRIGLNRWDFEATFEEVLT